MGRWLLVLLLLVLAGIAVLWLPGGQYPAYLRYGAVDRRVFELRPIVEEVVGGELGGPVTVHVTGVDEMAQVLSRELAGIYAGLEDGLPGEAAEIFAENAAQHLSPFVLGKVEIETGALHLVSANVHRIGDFFGDGAALRDVVLIHEMVHVYQHERFDLGRFLRGARTMQELIARSSVIEGHAEFITRRVARRLGLEEAFLFAAAEEEKARDVDRDLIRRFGDLQSRLISFPYRQGERLVEAAFREWGSDATERLFKEPPRTVLEVTDPDRYAPRSSESARFDKAVRRVRRLVNDEREARHFYEPEVRRRGLADVAVRGATVRQVELLLCRGMDSPEGYGRFAAVAFRATVEGDPLREKRLSTRVHELVRAVHEDSPWTGLEGRAAHEAILAALVDPHWGVRWRAARNLARVEPWRDGIEEALRRSLADEDPSVRIAAARTLKRHGWLNADDLRRLERDADPEVVDAGRALPR